jgi:hypothetical protein
MTAESTPPIDIFELALHQTEQKDEQNWREQLAKSADDAEKSFIFSMGH